MFPLRFSGLLGRSPCRELEARADPELLVGAAEVALDRLLGDEQRLGDLAVGASFGRLTADPPLRRGQRVRPGQLDPRAAARAGLELGARAVRPARSRRTGRPARSPGARRLGPRAAGPRGSARHPRSASACASSSRAALGSRIETASSSSAKALVLAAPRGPPRAATCRAPRRARPAARPASCSRASASACSCSPSEASAGAARALQSHGHSSPSASSRSTAPQQVRDSLAHLALRDPQAPSSDQVLVAGTVDPRRSRAASPVGSELVGGVELAALDVHDDRHREELHEREMRLLDQPQAGLGLDLRVVKRSPRERDRGALPVDEALPGRVTLTAGPFQREVEQSKRAGHSAPRAAACAEPGNRRSSSRDGGSPAASAASTCIGRGLRPSSPGGAAPGRCGSLATASNPG